MQQTQISDVSTGSVVATTVAVLAGLKIVLDIATAPAHRSALWTSVLIARDFVPAAVLAGGLLASSSIAAFAALVLAVINFILRDGSPTRVETAYLVLFVCLALFVVQLEVVRDFAEALPSQGNN